MAPVLVPLLIFAEGLAGQRALMPHDGYRNYLPWYQAAADALKRGELPGLLPTSFAGSPLFAIGQAGVLYPPNWAHLVLPPVLAYNLGIVAQFVIAGIGAWLLARHLTGDPVAAAVAGVAFAQSGFFFAHVGHAALLASAAWLPWVLYGYERLRERPTFGRALFAGAALAASFLAGHAQLAFMITAFLGLYAAGVTLLLPRTTRGRPIAAAAILVVAGFGLAGAQLVPTARFVPDSNREHLSYADAMAFSLPGSHTPLLAFPYLFGNNVPAGPADFPYSGDSNMAEVSGYPGLAAVALAAAGLASVRRDRRLLALLLAGLVFGAIALGPATPLSRLVYRLPVYGQFRSWGRYIVGLDLALACAAAYGVAWLRQPPQDTRRVRVAVARAAATVALLALLGAFVGRLDAVRPYLPSDGVRPAAVLLPLAAAGLGVLGAVALGRRWRLAAPAVVALVAFDAAAFGFFADWRTGSPPAAAVEAAQNSRQTFWGNVDDRPGGLDRFLYLGIDISTMGNDFPTVTDYKGMASANGFSPLAPAGYLEALGMSDFGAVADAERFWNPQSRTLDLLRVTTVVVDPVSSGGGPPPGSLLGGPGGEPVAGSPLRRYGYEPRLPEAFLVGRAESRPPSAVLDALWGRAPFDPGALALVEKPCAACPTTGPAGPAGRVTDSRFGAGSVRLEVVAEREAMAVVSQAWLPGWKAQVDGRAAPVLRVDGVVAGVPVPAGAHRVSLRYEIPGFRLGFALSAGTLTILLAGVAVERLRRDRR